MNIISLLMHKGGVAKSTLSVNLAAAFARMGMRTVLIDGDEQGSASASVGVPKHDAMAALLLQDADWPEVLARVPDTFAGEGLDFWLLSAGHGQKAVKNHAEVGPLFYERMQDLNGWADVVIVDTAPGTSNLHIGVYYASDYVLLPTMCDALSVDQLVETLDYLAEARRVGERTGYPAAQVMGIVPTQFMARHKLEQANWAWIHDTYGAQYHIFDPVRKFEAWRQAAQYASSIYTFRPSNDFNTLMSAGKASKDLDKIAQYAAQMMGVGV